MREDLNLSPQREESRGEGMRTPDEVSAMIRLKALGWGSRRIAAELGCGRETVRRWLETGRWRGYRRPGRPKKLDGLETWLQEKFRQHRGNADVVRQDLQREHGIVISLRTRALGCAFAAAIAGGSAGKGSVRDAAGQAVADRLWRDAFANRR